MSFLHATDPQTDCDLKKYKNYCWLNEQLIKINLDNKCIYLGLLNSSFTKESVVKKDNVFGFLLFDNKYEFVIKQETVK